MQDMNNPKDSITLYLTVDISRPGWVRGNIPLIKYCCKTVSKSFDFNNLKPPGDHTSALCEGLRLVW